MPRQYWIRQEKRVWVKSPSGTRFHESSGGSQEFPWIYVGKSRVKFRRTAFDCVPSDLYLIRGDLFGFLGSEDSFSRWVSCVAQAD